MRGGRLRSVAGLTVIAAVGWFVRPSPALAHGPVPPAPGWPETLLAWTIDPLPLLGVFGAALGYWWLVRRVERRHPRNPVPRTRHWAWMGGLAAVVAALLSPIETYSGALLTVHMGQHLLLQFVAAPLLLLAAPVTVLLRAVGPATRRGLLIVLHSRLVRALTFPLLAWFLFAAVNWGWHLSDLYDLALEVEWVHYLQHLTLFGAALLFWFPVVGADPGPWRLPHPMRLFYLFLAMPQNSFLGVAILNAAGVLYPHYATTVRAWGPSPPVDQQAAGTLMWVWGDLALILAMFAVIAAWVRQEERRNDREEARLDAEARL
ncbi:MAG: cytochrome c oxidase assembly protein [Chloroflexota bacterium]|nr:cytochrome c oxidase assembly protein [Chloroflexota bacterium]